MIESLGRAIGGLLLDLSGALLLMFGLSQWHEVSNSVPTIGFWNAFVLALAFDLIVSAAIVTHQD